MKILTTERLCLRPVTKMDFAAMAELDSDPNVMRYLCIKGPLPSYEKALEEMHYILELRAPSGAGTWTIICKTTRAFFGWVWVVFIDDLPDIDLGYRLAPKFWGCGYAIEAVRRVADHVFLDLRVSHLTALIHPSNLTSVRVAQKIGLSLTGTMDKFGIAINRYAISKNRYIAFFEQQERLHGSGSSSRVISKSPLICSGRRK